MTVVDYVKSLSLISRWFPQGSHGLGSREAGAMQAALIRVRSLSPPSLLDFPRR